MALINAFAIPHCIALFKAHFIVNNAPRYNLHCLIFPNSDIGTHVLIFYNIIFTIFTVGGKWISLEILNIPWSKELLDFTSEMFKNAKYVVERAVSKIIIIGSFTS